MISPRPIQFTLALFGCCLAFATAALAADLRVWTDATGKHTVKAEFVKLDGDKVVLKREDGKVVELPLSKLNKFSQNQARIAAEKAGSPVPSSTSPEPSSPTPSPSSDSLSSSSSKSKAIDFPANPSAKEFLDLVFGELRKKNYIVVWDAMPSSYQSDVNRLSKMVGEKIDPAIFKQIKQSVTSLTKMLRSKKKFVLGSRHLEAMGPQKEMLVMCYDEVINFADALTGVELMDAANFKKGDMRLLAEKYFTNLNSKMNALAAKFPADNPINQQFLNPPPIEYTLTQETPTSAIINLQAPGGGPPSPDTSLVNVDGRWLPAPMVDQWEQAIGQATAQLSQITPEANAQLKMQLGLGTAMFSGQIVPLQNAETQEEFDAALEEIIAQVQQLIQMGQPGMNGFNPNGPNN
jgi:SLA1 homology domain 1, SHD1